MELLPGGGQRLHRYIAQLPHVELVVLPRHAEVPPQNSKVWANTNRRAVVLEEMLQDETKRN